jgi:hypothetical protein
VDTDNSSVPFEPDEGPAPSSKLDYRYFSNPALCPFMVRQGARRAFELFLYLAGRFLYCGGREISDSHEQLCRACRLDPTDLASRPAISRLLRMLRETYQVIDFTPVRRRRPAITLRAPGQGDLLAPQRYVYVAGLIAHARELFDGLGSCAFAAEYMWIISRYEASLAERKYRRAYWYYPLEKIAASYHISESFASTGLRALVDAGLVAVSYGQRHLEAREDEFGRANRYYHRPLGRVLRRDEMLCPAEDKYPAEFAAAQRMAATLINGSTVRNVTGLCRLLACYGEAEVTAIIAQLQGYPRRNLRRRLAYVEGILRKRFPALADEEKLSGES